MDHPAHLEPMELRKFAHFLQLGITPSRGADTLRAMSQLGHSPQLGITHVTRDTVRTHVTRDILTGPPRN